MTANSLGAFTPKAITTVGIRAGSGPNVLVALGVIQRTTALRAYANFRTGRDWMEELATAYVVAIGTRSADAMLMQVIQQDLAAGRSFSCARCKEATIGTKIIRERLFPKLKSLREHANDLVHHLDDPANKGVADLNIEGVVDYCYHLFQENAEALFGSIPNPSGLFPSSLCKKCRTSP